MTDDILLLDESNIQSPLCYIHSPPKVNISALRSYLQQQDSFFRFGTPIKLYHYHSKIKCYSDNEGPFNFFELLPLEMWFVIFSNLEVKELVPVSLVCKWWYVLACDRLLWKELYLNRWGKTNEILLRNPEVDWRTMFKEQAQLVKESSSQKVSKKPSYKRKHSYSCHHRPFDMGIIGGILEQQQQQEKENIGPNSNTFSPPHANSYFRKRRRTKPIPFSLQQTTLELSQSEQKALDHDLKLKEFFDSLDQETLLVE